MKGFSLRFRIESKLFNGYVIQPIPIVILVGFTLIAFLFIAIWCTVEELSPPENTEYAIKESMFVSYSRDEYFFFMKADEYIIKTDDDGAFSLPVDTVESEEILERIIKNRMPVVVSYNVPSNPNAKVYYIAEITNADGTVIVDREAISAARAENSREGLTMLWVICLVYWGLGIGGYCILCHAPEHPRLAGLLIRREFRNF